jgi:hypothetical protein
MQFASSESVGDVSASGLAPVLADARRPSNNPGIMRWLISPVALVIVAVFMVPAAIAGKVEARAGISGKISSLGRSSVTVSDGKKLTCRVGRISPLALGYVLGSGARITCRNGLLTKFVGTDQALAPIYQAGPLGPGGTVNSFAFTVGTVGALTPTSVTIGGLSCSVGTRTPDLSGYAVGDRVSVTCTNGTLTAIKPAA